MNDAATDIDSPKGNSEQPLSTRANMVWNSIGNFIYLFSQWLLTYVVVRVLGYENAGFFSLAMTLGTSFYCIALYTMRNFQTSDIKNEYTPRTYLWSRYLTCTLSVIVSAVFSILNGYEPYTLLCIVVYTLFKSSEALADVYYGIMQKKLRMDYIGISFAAKGIAEFLVFLIVVVITHNLLSAIASLVMISFAIVFLYDRRMALLNVDQGDATWATVKALLIVCLPIAVYGFLFNTSAQLPRYFIELTLGAEQLGYYTSIAMPVVIVQVFANFIFAPLITPMAQHLHDGNRSEFNRMLWRTIIAITLISIAAFVGFGLFGNWFLIVLFGDSIAPYTYLLNPLILCTILTALAWFLSAVVTVLRRLKTLLALSSVMFVMITAGSVPFINQFGLNGGSFILALALAIFVTGCAASIFRASRNDTEIT